MRNLTWGFILITIGVLVLLDNLGVADFSDLVRDYWPLILIVWGLSILVRRRPQAVYQSAQQPSGAQQTQTAGSASSQPVASDLVHQSNVFGDIYSKVTSQNFKGGSLSTVFGDAFFDLSGAAFAEGDHELRVSSVFGDTTIILPKDAAVLISASSLFGDVTILDQHKGGFSSDMHLATPAYTSSSRRLRIHASKVFGDIRVQ